MNYKQFFKENKKVLIGLFIIAILAFGFFGTNLILNVDGINDLPMKDMAQGWETHLAMGRWGWALVSLIFGYMPVPFFLLILNCLLLSISSIYISKIFNLNNKIYQFILGAILICFPYAANVFSYTQWQFIYGLGIFIIIYGIYKLKNSKKIIDIFIPTCLFTLAISFYQAFLPVIITFLVTLAILDIIDKTSFKPLLIKIGKYLLTIALSCLIYMLITKLLINIFNIELLEYQNSKEMFNISLANLFPNLYTVLYNILNFFVDQLTFPLILKIVLYLLLLFGILINAFEIKKVYLPLYLVLIIVLIFTPHALEIVDPNRWFHDITLLGYLALFTTGVGIIFKFIEQYFNTKIIMKITLFIFIPIIFFLIITFNKAAVLSNMASNAALNYINRLQMRVESLEGYYNLPNPKKYYIVQYLGSDYFPFNRDLYPYSIGITTSYIMNEKDIVDAIRVLGIDATTASDKIDKETKASINKLIYENKNGKSCYPDKEALFIYKDIIVIHVCRDVIN